MGVTERVPPDQRRILGPRHIRSDQPMPGVSSTTGSRSTSSGRQSRRLGTPTCSGNSSVDIGSPATWSLMPISQLWPSNTVWRSAPPTRTSPNSPRSAGGPARRLNARINSVPRRLLPALAPILREAITSYSRPILTKYGGASLLMMLGVPCPSSSPWWTGTLEPAAVECRPEPTITNAMPSDSSRSAAGETTGC